MKQVQEEKSYIAVLRLERLTVNNKQRRRYLDGNVYLAPLILKRRYNTN